MPGQESQMAGKDQSPDEILRKVFIITMIGSALYIGSSFIIILW
jgi:hypothetical protein